MHARMLNCTGVMSRKAWHAAYVSVPPGSGLAQRRWPGPAGQTRRRCSDAVMRARSVGRLSPLQPLHECRQLRSSHRLLVFAAQQGGGRVVMVFHALAPHREAPDLLWREGSKSGG